MSLLSIPHIVDVEILRGARAHADSAIDLVIEVPHGATSTADYTEYAGRLTSPLPDALIDFFHVNTDAGAPELGLAAARHFIAAEPTRSAAVLRCRIPRTFIDTNRLIDASPADFKAGKLTPGLMPWITSPEDRTLLRAAYDRYLAAVRAALDQLTPDGALLLLHTYAPRSVDVEVGPDIVDKLHAAYRPEVEPTWPLRPALDVIGRGLDGTNHAPAPVVDALRAALTAHDVADSATYPLHPGSLAWDHAIARPGRVLCLEVRRDLLADPFLPFVEKTMDPALVDRLAAPLATALRRWWG
jgi:hypothetical protein